MFASQQFSSDLVSLWLTRLICTSLVSVIRETMKGSNTRTDDSLSGISRGDATRKVKKKKIKGKLFTLTTSPLPRAKFKAIVA